MQASNIDHVLILSAGKGTRMGEIGEVLPKVMWPVFERSLLELQVLYAKEIMAKNIYINSYFYKKELKAHWQSSNVLHHNSELLEEEVELDIGGAIHNLAGRLNYQGKLLILNSDQFIFLSPESWKNAFCNLEASDHLLFSYEVDSSHGYNLLKTKKKYLAEIEKASTLKEPKVGETYTGMSILNLEKLSPFEGKSSFFDKVANPKLNRIFVQNIADAHYWDFGTLNRYWNSMFNALKLEDDTFVKFLKKTESIDSKKINLLKNSYNSTQLKSINLTKSSANDDKIEYENSIILRGQNLMGRDNNKEDKKSTQRKIIFNQITQFI